MPQYLVDGLTFDFPDTWFVSKYDDSSFYRNRFIRIRAGIKALDLLALGPDGTAWLIEAKDYRYHPRTKPSDLADEVGQKVVDTLAAILPAKINGDVDLEVQFASRFLKAQKMRIVLHLEQPLKHSKLFPRAIDPADVQMRIRQQLKSVDSHPLVVEMCRMGSLPWNVS